MLGDIFLLAVAAAFYPTLLAIVILILARPKATRLLAAYLVGGMIVGIAAGCVVVFVLKGSVSSGSNPNISPIVDLVAGAISLGLAVLLVTGRDPRPQRLRKARESRDRSGKHGDSWTKRAVAGDSLVMAFVLGLVLDLPSVWYLAALKDIWNGHYSTAVDLLLIFAFLLIMFVLVEVPLVGYLVAPERTRAAVERFNAWLHSHARQLGEGIAGGIGLYLSIKGIAGLV